MMMALPYFKRALNTVRMKEKLVLAVMKINIKGNLTKAKRLQRSQIENSTLKLTITNLAYCMNRLKLYRWCKNFLSQNELDTGKFCFNEQSQPPIQGSNRRLSQISKNTLINLKSVCGIKEVIRQKAGDFLSGKGAVSGIGAGAKIKFSNLEKMQVMAQFMKFNTESIL